MLANGRAWVLLLTGGSAGRARPGGRPALSARSPGAGGGDTPLLRAYARVARLVDPSHVYVCTVAERDDRVRAELREVAPQHFLVQPRARGTAAALALAGLHLERAHPGCVVVAVPAEHPIDDGDAFRAAVVGAAHAALAGEHLVAVGVRPARAGTGYGYIQCGPRIAQFRGVGVYRALGFVEKPERRLARSLAGSGRYLWHSGILAGTARRLLAEVSRHLPEVGRLLEASVPGDGPAGGGLPAPVPAALLEAFPSVSFERAVLEKTDRLLVVPGEFRCDGAGLRDGAPPPARPAAYDVFRAPVLQERAACGQRGAAVAED